MTKSEAHAHLDRLREGQLMPVFLTTQALQLTGDIRALPGKTLCGAGEEPRDHRTRQIHDQTIPTGFSYSAYLDKTKIERIA
jgi:hypothetical protein